MNNHWQLLMTNLPLFIPLVLLEVGLMLAALIHALRHSHYRFGNRVFWIVVILFIQIVGPLTYFVFGRGEN
ncbi:PLDc N-terminal domain-containing protein [Liquorilactobacillus satsumensis]|uniref:Cardiolipin synthase N-terminal domain-containing protein n=1 Tax=Liquorilactobacillus satsumensis DSM 16230 = JCM 12392 TaxID=1423801 RepID=A0A0R1UUG9_9LACO|nr:PLD nuclease N-terminal domain-containing protein [Liquorilactobacillus satsumensis]KRL96758.1 hypothetical protein FD50_GL002038 [Liquorilactobacillus satsumensis DSM 16230 = JCM 12392]MCC7666104.1 hypothetical protein [Liquorilactobacillus satsumensis]MCP9312558.1 PLDc_N domain-containing protein [Liquorilactobacillus satsumensis]MCP9328861.1 PLDc_N domain-containing protein [Liquorilactobacillus satsumensis]MCP9356789.1 PLDc_N domain-containing protein [Liquorilactobacillus satsumensis]